MRYRALCWLPILFAAPFFLAELFMAQSTQTFTIRVEVELAKVLWLFGALAAARVFEAGDYLRRGWLLMAAASAFYLLRDATMIPAFEGSVAGATLGIVRGLLVIVGNVSQVWGVWVLARVWSAAGLDDAVRGQRRLLFVAAVGLSVLLTGPSIVHDALKLVSGDIEAVPHLASDLGDAIAFVLLAALVRTALALRGGVVFWTWSLLAASEVAWMSFDGARTLTELWGPSPYAPPSVECLRVLGAVYFFAAGLAQRWVVSS